MNDFSNDTRKAGRCISARALFRFDLWLADLLLRFANSIFEKAMK